MHRWLTASAQARVAASPTARACGCPGALAWMATVGWLALDRRRGDPADRRRADVLRRRHLHLGRSGRGTASRSSSWRCCSSGWPSLSPRSPRPSCFAAAEPAPTDGAGDLRRWASICVAPLLVTAVAFGAALFVDRAGDVQRPESRRRSAAPHDPGRGAVRRGHGPGRDARVGRPRRRDPWRAAETGGPWSALAAAPRLLGRAGGAAVVQIVAQFAARIGYFVVATVLLRVLWAPIEAPAERRGIRRRRRPPAGRLRGDLALPRPRGRRPPCVGVGPWTRLLEARGRDAGAVAQMESRSRP